MKEERTLGVGSLFAVASLLIFAVSSLSCCGVGLHGLSKDPLYPFRSLHPAYHLKDNGFTLMIWDCGLMKRSPESKNYELYLMGVASDISGKNRTMSSSDIRVEVDGIEYPPAFTHSFSLSSKERKVGFIQEIPPEKVRGPFRIRFATMPLGSGYEFPESDCDVSD